MNSMNDRENIEQFVNSNRDKDVVVIQGLGFVGAVMSLICANSLKSDYAVIGVDLKNDQNLRKIDSFNSGVFPISASDPKINEFYKRAKLKGNIYATFDHYAYKLAKVIVVDVNLDVEKESNTDGKLLSYQVDLTHFKQAIQTIADNCREDVLIVVETTVPPGTCSKIVKPIIEATLEKRGLRVDQFKLGHSYERVMPGPQYIDSIQNFYRVYSGINDESADATENFLKTIISVDEYPLTRLSNTNSTEYAKVLENSYRAMNISFATEWSRFAEEANVNMYEVVDAIRMRPTHSNLMYPGIGVGGYCLTKDPLLASWSKENHFGSETGLEQSEQGVMTNDLMPLFAFNYMMKSFDLTSMNGVNVLILGVSYRSDVADTRYSPVNNFYEFCLQRGAEVIFHDPYVEYWDEQKLEIMKDIEKCLDQDFNLAVIATSHSCYKNSDRLISGLMQKNDLMVYDTVGVLNDSEISILKTNHVVKVLGRGDI